jgi:glycine C-acetyltransferase
MSDIHELKFLQDQIQELKEQGLFRKIPVVQSANEAEIIVDGHKVINLSSNNYLGFANHPRLKEAAIAAIREFGVGAGAVKTIVGNMSLHEKLEHELAIFKREEAVLLFQSGFNCNAGVIQALTGVGDLIVSDALNHASIIDGIRLSKADRAVYPHSDMEELRKILLAKRELYKQVLIITDGVFSMDGDLAKLPAIVALAEEFQCLTYVDDAHGSGVLGENGRGIVDHFHLHGRVDFTIGTLSKAFGVVGGYVAGKQVMKEWLSLRARPLLFSTNLPPAVAGALLEALKMLGETDEYTRAVWDNSVYFKDKMHLAGFDIGHSETPITPVFIYDEALTMRFSKRLFELGVFVSPIVFPTVPKGKARLRVMVTALHTRPQLDRAVNAFVSVAKEFGLPNT